MLVVVQVVLITLASSGARAQNTVGTVTDLAGSAHVERGGATQAVTSGMAVELKDKFTTDAGAHLTITLNDNSKLDLADQSTLVIDEQVVGAGGPQTTKVSLLGGHLQSLVTKALRGTAPSFEVKTPNAIAGVRGTKFSVGYSSSSPVCGPAPTSDVAVAEGTVTVANSATPSAELTLKAATKPSCAPCGLHCPRDHWEWQDRRAPAPLREALGIRPQCRRSAASGLSALSPLLAVDGRMAF